MITKACAARKRAARNEIVHAAAWLERKARRFAPGTLAFLGKSHSAITAPPHVDWGRQPNTFGDARVWVLPNVSGLNHERTDGWVKAPKSLRRDLAQQCLVPQLGPRECAKDFRHVRYISM